MTRKFVCGDLVQLSGITWSQSYAGKVAFVVSTDVSVAVRKLFGMRDMILITDPTIPDTFLEVLLREIELFQCLK